MVFLNKVFLYFSILTGKYLRVFFKGTLMQIWKSPYMFEFIYKTMLWKFRFLNPKNPKSYLSVKFVNFLKSRLIFNFSHISRAHISKTKRCFNVKSSQYYFHMNVRILTDFQICISVPLIKLSLASNVIKKETLAQVSSCKFCKFFRNTFLQSAFGRLLLQVQEYPCPQEVIYFLSTVWKLRNYW